MNDPTFVEAAKKLAERMRLEAENSPEARIARGFRLVTSRAPSKSEIKLLARLYQQQRLKFSKEPKKASALLRVGDSGVDPTLPIADLAAFTVVANVIFNLDEAITIR